MSQMGCKQRVLMELKPPLARRSDGSSAATSAANERGRSLTILKVPCSY